jgi:hypothetical protein
MEVETIVDGTDSLTELACDTSLFARGISS